MHREGYGYKFLEEIKAYSPCEANPMRMIQIVDVSSCIPLLERKVPSCNVLHTPASGKVQPCTH